MPTQTVIDTLLGTYGWAGKPAADIVNMPGRLLAGIGVKLTLWQELNENVWRYARANQWVWIDAAGANGAKNHVGSLGGGKPAAVNGLGTLGIPLLEGTNPAKSCNCGVFNATVRQLAYHILGFKDNEVSDAFTDKTFVTLPARQTFDLQWTGNVRTVATDFPALGALKFTNHSFSKGPDGNFTDATSNVPTFGTKTDIMWFDLKKAKSTMIIKETAGWLIVDNIYNPALLPAGGPPYYLISSAELKAKAGLLPVGGAPLTRALAIGVPDVCATNGAWPNWWLLTPADLPVEFKNWARYFLPIPGFSSGG